MEKHIQNQSFCTFRVCIKKLLIINVRELSISASMGTFLTKSRTKQAYETYFVYITWDI